MKCIKCGTTDINYDFSEGKIACKFCGFLIEENLSNPEISYEGKDRGKFSINGQFVRNTDGIMTGSKIKCNDLILSGAKRKINQLGHSLKVKGAFNDEAFRFFILATQKGVSGGQKLLNLCISSLYAVCRRKKTHHLLIDFADITQIQTNKIGSVFLKFTRSLNINIPVIDPSLYIQRFVSGLQIGNKTQAVAMSALRLIARMKREWVSTGRRPSGLCGAAILLASKMHGIRKNQKEISDIVRIGDVAIRSRLREINKTSIGLLTIDEIDRGGGDDGSGNSLLEFSSAKIQPPSMISRIERTKKETRNEKIYGKKTYNRLMKDNSKSKNLDQNFRKQKIILAKKCNLKKNKAKFSMGKKMKSIEITESLCYINSNYETTIKESIWNEINTKYLCSHSIVARAQKEKPFAFFRMNGSSDFANSPSFP